MRFKKETDRHRSLLGKLLLKWTLRKVYGIQAMPELTYNQYKRPYLKEFPSIDFNISHSGGWVVCGVTDNGQIGVDVQQMRPINLEIARRFFAPREANFIENSVPEYQLDYFYRFWTLKEAYIKAEGKGMHMPLDSFYFDLYMGLAPEIRLSSNGKIEGWKFILHEPAKDYKLAVCVSTNAFNYNLIKINMDRLTEAYL
ncbi:MAG: 4'-phosphopantetheinyl transferase superfamily protein [Chitinivibrionales bacterium]|nr:4'-phosphopantetheinyl transferase superfamily protein [Chitinivibrionales bacterium]